MRDSRYLAPALLQIAGLILLFACAIYWGVSGNQSSLFVGAAISLIGVGATQGIRVSWQRERERLSAPKQEADQ